MLKTIKLYDQSAYDTEFDAVVVSCEKVESKSGVTYQVVLDQTLFFPEEGGQTPDTGTLSGIEVKDVQVKNDIITHTLGEALEVGMKVHGEIDWKHRFNNMQQHSGEHIFSGLVHGKYGYDNVGFHLSDSVVTMDFNGVLTEHQVAEIEYEANQVIVSNRPIKVSFPSKEELSKLDYRSKIEIEGQVRIVTIPDVDSCACCAPHVRWTGEIGMLKVMSVQNYKGGVRISILCGFRALEEYRMKCGVISSLSQRLSANQDTILDAVDKLKANVATLKNDAIAAKREYMNLKLESLEKGLEDVYLFEESLEAPMMREVANRLTKEHSGYCGIFVGNDDSGYRYIIGSSEKDSNVIAKKLRESLGAKGGGSAQMVQGSVTATKEAILDLL